MIYRSLLLNFFVLFISFQAVIAQVVIFNFSPTARPGEAVSLQGNFSANAKAFMFSGSSGTSIPLPVLVQSANQATVQIPAPTKLSCYQIWIEDQGQKSPVVNVNQAISMHIDSPDVTPGGNLRIFGRNLFLNGGTPKVRLVARGTNNSLDATINTGQSDAYKLSVKMPPSLQPGTVYAIYLSNGLESNVGEILIEQTVTAISGGADYFQLGIGWAAKLDFYRNVYNVKTDPRLSTKAVGDGQHNDQPAIQQAIDKAFADGGGIVYLPAGTYKMLYNYFEYIKMNNRVVVQGAGKYDTVIKFGYELEMSHLAVFWPPGVTQAGLADLSIINIDTYGGDLLSNSRGQGTEIFMQRVLFDLNKGDWLWLANSNKFVIANSDLIQGESRVNHRGPLQLDGCSNFVLYGNTFNYKVDGLNLNNIHDAVFENNRVFRDGSARYPQGIVNHVLILNFAENIAVINNLFKVINGPAQNSNDGETIISEGGGADRIDEETGTVSSASGSTLQDNSKNWNGFRLKPVVAIVNGKGMGQWRRITSRNGNTLNLDRPWDVIPDAGSRYTIFNWGSRNWLLQGNTMEGNRRGITLYHNATTQVAIVNNTLTNSGSIDLTPVQHNDGSEKFIPMYNNQITGNTVSNTDGSNGVFIGVHTVQHAQSRTFGTSVIGLEMRYNTLTAGRPNIPAIVDAPFPEGFLNYLEYHPIENYFEEQVPAILGSILENNTAVNCNNAVYLNPGTYNTFLCNTNLVNAGNLLSDGRFDGIGHASVRTVTCSTIPLPVRLATFEVVKNENQAQITWTTSSEDNTDYFEVQRSFDASNWKKIGEVAAAKQSDSLLSYSYIDINPLQNSALSGTIFYRLKMTDLDGTFAYSRIRNLTFKETGSVILYPNPVSDRLYFATGDLAGIESVKIIDSLGRIMSQFTEIRKDGISTTRLVPGLYIIQIKKRSGELQYHKVFVEK